jgi:hypothetical protein
MQEPAGLSAKCSATVASTQHLLQPGNPLDSLKAQPPNDVASLAKKAGREYDRPF